MTYTPTTWADLPATTSPVDAANLNHLEQGVAAAALAAAGAGDASSIQGHPVSNINPAAGQVLGWDGATWTPVAGGGVAGNATQLQGRAVSASAPTNGQSLIWSAFAAQWVPGAGGGGGGSVDGTSVKNLLTLSVGTTDDMGTVTPIAAQRARFFRSGLVTDNARALQDAAFLVTIEDDANLGGMFSAPNASYDRYGMLIQMSPAVHSNMSRVASMFLSGLPAVDNGVKINDYAAMWIHDDVFQIAGQPESARSVVTHYGVLAHIGALYGSADTAFGVHSEIARFTTTGLSGYDNTAHFHVSFNNASRVSAKILQADINWFGPAASGAVGMNLQLPDYPSSHVGPVSLNGNYANGPAQDSNIGLVVGSGRVIFTGNGSTGGQIVTATDGTVANLDWIGHAITGPGIPANTFVTGGIASGIGISQALTAGVTGGTFTVAETRLLALRPVTANAIAGIPSGNLQKGMIAFQGDGSVFKPTPGMYFYTGAQWSRIVDGSNFNYCDPNLSSIFDLAFLTVGTTDNVQTGLGARIRLKDVNSVATATDRASFNLEVSNIYTANVDTVYGITLGTKNTVSQGTIATFTGTTINNIVGINSFFSSGGAGTFGSIYGAILKGAHTAGSKAGAIYGANCSGQIPFGAITGGSQYLVGMQCSAQDLGGATGGVIDNAVSLWAAAPISANNHVSNSETFRWANSANGTTDLPFVRGYGPWSLVTTDGVAHQIAGIPLSVIAGTVTILVTGSARRTAGLGTANDGAGYGIAVTINGAGTILGQSQLWGHESGNAAPWNLQVGTPAFGVAPIQVVGATGVTVSWNVFAQVQAINS